ncbi:hypothetical protein CY34DRAFT_799299 [Suillus luteus UH-Slu-Lm8-n1]|uniref:Uncharacterized protein n=1 Tax=Suillus luteus UH-Slu-Lm8-n1 TaxID=930992 RepID=A0A0D0BXF2_9AGAM|nr:hypothetical protein CY34DRAFT_799299 [Suillus luteus UH-Slu-Lm8-n1]
MFEPSDVPVSRAVLMIQQTGALGYGAGLRAQAKHMHPRRGVILTSEGWGTKGPLVRFWTLVPGWIYALP